MPRLLIAAAHKSSGKTTVSIGLCAALGARGHTVQPFKKGPDYIDPMWLTRACGRDCYNLDPFLMSAGEIDTLFRRHAAGSDLALVEGNKGLYDGLALDGSNSNAALAAQLDLPVILVIDAQGMTRGIAPLLLGYQAFDRGIRIAGVILNRLGGARHEAKLRAVVEHYTDIPVLGAVHCDERLAIVERHLGLVPANEAHEAQARIAGIGAAIAAQVDLDRVFDVGASATPLAPTATIARLPRRSVRRVRVGIAMDRAFGFYYPDDLAALRDAGAELLPFDTLHDERLPEVDALFLGGGFPETCAAELEANAVLRAGIRAAIEDGLPVYAECGGLMYLARTLETEGCRHAMVGAIPGDVVMHRRPVGRGYVELVETAAAPWPRGPATGERVRAHEFHYSSLENLGDDVRFAWRVARGHGIDGQHDGLVHCNVLASYTHLRSVGGCDWPGRFVDFARQVRQQREDASCPEFAGVRPAASRPTEGVTA